jgi:hypothetical protein
MWELESKMDVGVWKKVDVFEDSVDITKHTVMRAR